MRWTRPVCCAALAVFVLGACNAIVGIEPAVLRTDACDEPQAGTARLRIGDLVPSTDRYDVCLHRTDGSNPFEGVPLPTSPDGGPTNGIGYEQVLAPINVPAGSYTISVQHDGAGCGGAPVASASVCIRPGATSVFAIGDGVGATQLATFPESASPTSGTRLRFVHAIAGEPKLDFGRAVGALPDATLTPIFSGVAFGSTAPRGATTSDGPIDDDGYVQLTPPATNLPLAAGPSGAPNVTLAKSPVLSAQRYTVLAVGSVSDVRFPEELFVCDETAERDGLTDCGGQPFDVTIDTYSTALFGVFSPLSKLRHDPLIDAVAHLKEPGIVCLHGLTFDADKTSIQIKALAAGHLLYSIKFVDTLDTPVDDPTDQNGLIPAPPTTPACPASTPTFDDLIGCLQSNCAAMPGDSTSTLADDAAVCMASSCPAQVEALVAAAPECWMCTFGQLGAYVSFDGTRAACSTDPRARLAFGGASDMLMLSNYAIRDVKQWVLPSTLTRSSILSASINLPNGADVDVYCLSTRAPGDGVLVPYTGQYGNGLTGNAAWRQELLLQTDKAIHYIKNQSIARGRRAIVAGQFNCGPDSPPALGPNNTESWSLLAAAFPMAIPPGQPLPCTFCVDNPILNPPGRTPGGRNTLGDYSMLANVPVTDVVSTSIVLTDPVIPYDTYAVPLSYTYDFRTTVRIRP